jgi:hypothetical protein
MNIRIYVKNALTKQVEIDNVISVINEDIEIIRANHQVFVEAYPDCHVNFEWEAANPLHGKNFIAGMPLNMERDQDRVAKGEMTWQEEMSKWHGMQFPLFSLS